MVCNKLDVFQAPAVAEGRNVNWCSPFAKVELDQIEASRPLCRRLALGRPAVLWQPRAPCPPGLAGGSRLPAPSPRAPPRLATPRPLTPLPSRFSPRLGTSSSPQAHLMQPASFQYILRVLNTNVDGRVSEYSRCRTLPCAAPLTFGAERRSRRRRWVYVVVPGEGLEGLLLPSLWCLAPEPLRRLACSVRGPPPAARRPPPAAHRPPPDVWRLLAARLSAITCTLLLRLPNAYPRLTPTALPPCSPAQRLCMR